MPITLTITGENAAQLHEQMIALLAGTASAVLQPTETSASTGKKSSGKKSTADGSADAGAATGGSENTTTTTSAGADGAAQAPTKETLTPKVMQLGSKSGPTAVQELFAEFGAASFSKVPAEQYGALDARLDQLLAG